jgi:hypothetical protein
MEPTFKSTVTLEGIRDAASESDISCERSTSVISRARARTIFGSTRGSLLILKEFNVQDG